MRITWDQTSYAPQEVHSEIGAGIPNKSFEEVLQGKNERVTNEGFGGPADDSPMTWFALALLNSLPAQCALNFYCGQHKGVGYVNALPFVGLGNPIKSHVVDLAEKVYNLRRSSAGAIETDPGFKSVFLQSSESCILASEDWYKAYQNVSERIEKLALQIDTSFIGLFEVDQEEINSLWESAKNRPSVSGICTLDQTRREVVELHWALSVISYVIGITFGRWDVRIALDPSLAPKLPDPFDPLPVCPPGMLVGPDGLPAKPGRIVSDDWLRNRPDANTLPPEGAVKNSTILDSEYPLCINWDGILVDDAGHKDDIVYRVRNVLEVIWMDHAEAIEREACEILGVKELHDYFRKPGNGGFWMDHVKRYSKSRRKAPIYWYLRSAKGNYGLWLYYHRLDKDILFKALLNYVEPKIRIEEDRLNALRARKEAAGSSGREAKQIEKDMDHQEQFISELHDFKDKLRHVADLHLKPDLNDGVVLNIAPLWELVPWSESKKYWEELQEGKYDWSHIAYQLWPERVEEACRKDRSIAIAHEREDLCEIEPPNSRRKKRGK